MPPAKDNENALKHGHGRRNRTTPEYRVWRNARNRCTNPLNDHWKWYGAKGVRFLAFRGRRKTTPQGEIMPYRPRR